MPILNWIGKEKVVSHHESVPYHVLEHKYGYTKEGVKESETGSGNMIIHGDNLVALKALMPKYEGKIDVCYLDPPYNTGEEGWCYNDNVNDPRILKWLGKVVDKEGEDLCRHDKWLCMMYPRLMLVSKLLSSKGTIFISIDDNELYNLKYICDEIFGSNCFVANISWQRTYSPRNDAKGISNEIEHLLVYSKNPDWSPRKLPRTAKMNKVYKNPDNDVALWRNSDAFAPGAATHQGMVYAIQHPFTGKLIYPYNGAHWPLKQSDMLFEMSKWGEYELRDLDDAAERAQVCGVSATEVRDGVMGIVLVKPVEEARQLAKEIYDRGRWPRFFFTNNGLGGIARKTYLDQTDGRVPTNLWKYEDVGHTDAAMKEIKAMFGSKVFDTPKPSTYIEQILRIASEPDSVVLDAFAGSATTGQAVLDLNAEDGGNRKFILCEMGDYADTVTAERIKKAISGYSFKGKKEEELFSVKLTSKSLLKGGELLAEAEKVSEQFSGEYDTISKPAVKDGCLVVTGTKTYDGFKEGIGGAFDFYEIGAPMFVGDGELNSDIPLEKIKEYIWHSETHAPYSPPTDAHPYFLGIHGSAAYYFCHEAGRSVAVAEDELDFIREEADSYIIYADRCLLEQEFMDRHSIIFKKSPRDIIKF